MPSHPVRRSGVRAVSSNKIELLQADARYYRDRVALLRAKLYRWGLGSSPRLEELERNMVRAEQRVRDQRQRDQRVRDQRQRDQRESEQHPG
jgi:hypothetical protein